MLTFAQLGLPEPLITTLTRRGMTAPFAIQAAALPDAIAGRDVLGRAQTGSGKTLAFGLPMLTRLAGRPVASRRPLGLIVVPTRELAFQVVDALAPLGHSLGVAVTSVVGGAPFGKQVTALSRGAAIVVATPGRLEDHIRQGTAALDDVEIAVLDEADHLCDLGFLPAVRRILDLVKPGGQRLLFSATLDAAVKSIVDAYLKNPVTHSTMPEGQPVVATDHHVLVIHPKDKTTVTAEIASRAGRTMLFVRTQHGADRLATQLHRVGVGAGSLHGGKTQAQRNKALAAFKDGTVSVLVATDVAARGIHVDDVDLVVQIDPAADHKDYLHRAGRTARAGNTGTVVTLASPQDERSITKLVQRAGVQVRATRVSPGSRELTDITGAAAVSGEPWVPPAPSRVERLAERPSRPGRPQRTERRPERGERFDRPARTDRPVSSDRPVRSDRPIRSERPVRSDRPVRTDRPARTDRPPTAATTDDRPRHERRASLQPRPGKTGFRGAPRSARTAPEGRRTRSS
jgi:superfamily II DNA/RNA helicase